MTASAKQEDWPTRLKADNPQRDSAIAELTEVLVRGLRSALSDQLSGGLQAEDIAQEAILRILRSVDTFQGKSKFTTWAMTVAMRVGISELRRKHYRDVSLDHETSDGEPLEFRIEAPHPGDEQRRVVLLKVLGEMIQTELSQRQKVAIQALLGGMPVEEIAIKTKSNRNAVYKLVHDARLKLRSAFEQRGITVEDVASVFA